jgi:hypothetical protein
MSMTTWLKKDFRREFANRHMGQPRKFTRILQSPSDYGRRRKAVKGLSAETAYPELRQLTADRFSRIALVEDRLQPLLEACDQRFGESSAEDMRVQEGKEFYLDLLRPEDYRPESPFMTFALDERLLVTASIYLKCAAYLQSIELIRSVPLDGSHPLYRSQLWHFDNNNDTRMLKLFVFVSDISEDQGPLTFLPYGPSHRVPWYEGHYLSDDSVFKHVSADQILRATGQRGSAYFVDTAAILHCGSRCRRPRTMFVLHFNTGFGFFPRARHGDHWRGVADSLTPLQRFALGLSGDRRSAA